MSSSVTSLNNQGYLPSLVITLTHLAASLLCRPLRTSFYLVPYHAEKAVVVIVDVNMVAGLNTGASTNSCNDMEEFPVTTLRPVRGQRFNSVYTKNSIYKLIWVRKHDDVISRDSHYFPEAL